MGFYYKNGLIVNASAVAISYCFSKMGLLALISLILLLDFCSSLHQ